MILIPLTEEQKKKGKEIAKKVGKIAIGLATEYIGGNSPINESTCGLYGGRVIIDEDGSAYCKIPEITKELIIEVSKDAPLDNYGQTYRNAIPQCGDDKECLGTQIHYMLNNVDLPKNDIEALSLLQLEQIPTFHKELPLQLPPKGSADWDLGEIEYGQIMLGFERATESIVGSRKLQMNDFQRYADRYGVPIQKVLVATDWTSEALSDEVQKARKEADAKMNMDWM